MSISSTYILARYRILLICLVARVMLGATQSVKYAYQGAFRDLLRTRLLAVHAVVAVVAVGAVGAVVAVVSAALVPPS